jgi:tetratricopeptide (TPR) repeat protein
MEFKLSETNNMDTGNINSPSICLNMIVKNESKIIVRLLESVLPIIDCFCICDTGSSDDTVEKIETFFKSKNIPGKIVREPFKNFAHNRNYALQSCKGMSDYIIFLDADMILQINNFDKKTINEYDSLTILQGSDDFYYQNVRIVKNNGLFSYVGVTHEYINTPSNNKNRNLEKDELFISDIGDGGSKHDKFERDIKLLTEAIEIEPKNDRNYFYLANTYHDSGNFTKAIEYYEKRIQLGGWIQEVWYSCYKIASCYKHMGKINDAINYWLLCYDYFPDRIESLYELVSHYRTTSKHKLSYFFYKMAKEIVEKKVDRDSYLFLHNDIYTYKMDYEFTIIAAYIGVKDISNEIVNILNKTKDQEIVNNLYSNMKWYKFILKPTKIISFDDTISITINNETINLYSSSSCLLRIPSSSSQSNNAKYCMNVRYVNYHIIENGSYTNCEKNIITGNKYIELDETMNIVTSKMFDIVYDERLYIGIEDIKIFQDVETKQIKYIGTGLHKNNYLGIVNGDYDIEKSELDIIELNQHVYNTQCEKNWVYVDYNNSSHVIYKWSPLQICKIDESNNTLQFLEERKMPNYFDNVRGSTCGFKYTNTTQSSETEIWFIQHMVSYENPRHYYHIISVFDKNMELLRYSAPFKFEGEPIEYCLSIVVEDDCVIINYSTWDRTTRIGIYDKKYIESLLKYDP